ncbi:MAG: hypothetical protein RLY93_05960 [Sumerlaeia bacterium]
MTTTRNYGIPRTMDATKKSTWVLYPMNRVMDLGDTVKGGIMFGPGLNARVRATKYLDITEPYDSYGLELGWNIHWYDPIPQSTPGYLFRRYSPWKFGAHGGPNVNTSQNIADSGEIWNSPDTFLIGGHLGIVGGEIGVRPIEFIDFLTGFVLLDWHQDDVVWIPVQR